MKISQAALAQLTLLRIKHSMIKRLLLTIKPQTAFASPLAGAMLFGQMCWSIRENYGGKHLSQLLEGYCNGTPFIVCSDAFPHGFLPLPTYPLVHWIRPESTNKEMKRKKWLPITRWPHPIADWHKEARSDREVLQAHYEGDAFISKSAQMHNSINRMTGTTSAGGMFAPYQSETIQYHPISLLDVYIDYDDERLVPETIVQCLSAIGLAGFGRDASIGLGKFSVEGSLEVSNQVTSKTVMTLSASVLGGIDLDSTKTFYNVQTYFGRHGNVRAIGEVPFKKPVLMARTGAHLTCCHLSCKPFIGKGVSGLSFYKDTVHQGYASVVNLLED